MDRDQFDQAMTKSVGLIKAMAAISKAQALLASVQLYELGAGLNEARAALDAEYQEYEKIVRRWREVE